jgi:hypothetical protein
VLRGTPNGWSDFVAKIQRNLKNIKPVDAPLISHLDFDDDHHHEGSPA